MLWLDNGSVKRTTLVLEEGCMDAIRRLAQREGRTMSELVNELLAEGIQRRSGVESPPEFELPAFRMGRPRVNLGDRDALESLMDS
jgi:hypothetical protein